MEGGSTKFLIIGAGAIGSVFGGYLSRAGNDVTFLDRKTGHVKAMLEKGLRVTGIWGEFLQKDNIRIITDFNNAVRPEQAAKVSNPCRRVQGSNGPSKSGCAPTGYDYACIAVKSYHTGEVLDEYDSILSHSRHVVSLQNGVGNVLEIARRSGMDRAIGVRIIFGAEITEPGTTKVTVKADDLAVGWVRGGKAEPGDGADRLNDIFNQAGLISKPVDNVVSYLWAKVLYNSALNGLGAILGVPYGKLLEREPTQRIMKSLMAEAFEVLGAEKVEMPWPDSDAYIKVLFEQLIPSTAAHRASMLQDIELGRPTEIDAFNGHIAALAQRHGIPAPVNSTISNLIRFLETKPKE